MDIPKRVIVRVKDCEFEDFCQDFELPTRMPIRDLSKGILKLLKVYGPNGEWDKESRYAKKISLSLFYNEIKLQNDQTLASVGIWDGSVIGFRAS